MAVNIMKSSAYLFASEVDQQIEAVKPDDYRMRRGRAKVLQEELLPISRLGLHLKLPGLHVEVEAFEDDGPVDGRIRITGYRDQLFGVEATCDFNYEESLRMELISSVGSAPGAGSIRRNRQTRQVLHVMAAVDIDEHIERVALTVINLFRKKNLKSYGEETVLIIAFEEIRLFGAHNWRQLYDALDRNGGFAGSQFLAIYLFNNATNEIQQTIGFVNRNVS